MGDLEAKLRFKKSDLEDWTKVEDKVLRKKIQDRLAKRKSRSSNPKRKHRNQQDVPAQQPSGHSQTLLATPPTTTSSTSSTTSSTSLTPSTLTPSPIPQKRNTSAPFNASILSFLLSPALHNPSTLSTSPLTEHHHIHLPHLSLYRAFVANINLLGLNLTDFEDDDCLSPWTVEHPYPLLSGGREGGGSTATNTGAGGKVGFDLAPTPTQLSVRHHPYVDLISPPGVRDRILKAGLSDEEDEGVCKALHWGSDGMGGFFVRGEWGWDASGWEVTQSFVDQWGWLVDQETLRVSNCWRARRGEEPLRVPDVWPERRVEEVE